MVLVEFYLISLHFYAWNRIPTPGSGPWCLRLLWSSWNPNRLWFCTLSNSSGSRGCCSPKLWPGPALCRAPESQKGQRLAAPRLHGGNVHASVPRHVFSREVQLSNARLVQDSCQRLAIQSSKKTCCTSIGMIWWSFFILSQSLHAFTSVRPAS